MAFIDDEKTLGIDGCITDDGCIVDIENEYESDGYLFD